MKRRRSTKAEEERLTQQLVLTIVIIVSLIILVVLSFTFFAPAVGSIFKIFSRNKTGQELIIKPNPPVITQLPDATKENKINITGYAQEGMTIKLFVNGPEKAETVVGTDGMFTFDEVELIKGRNTIFAKAIGTSNNESDKSQTYIVTVDDDSPEIDIESPQDGDIVKNLDKRITIKGKLNEKATLTINDVIAVVKPDLTFEYTFGVDEGDVQIKIKAIDEAGNEKEEIINVKYQKNSS